jgi:hypothetical protein
MKDPGYVCECGHWDGEHENGNCSAPGCGCKSCVLDRESTEESLSLIDLLRFQKLHPIPTV